MRNEISQKLAKESIPRFVSPEESAVAPQMFKSRRQSLSHPLAGFEFSMFCCGFAAMAVKLVGPHRSAMEQFLVHAPCRRQFWPPQLPSALAGNEVSSTDGHAAVLL